MGHEAGLRVVKEEDAKELLEIYRPYVEKTVISFEYETPSLEEFAGRIRRTLKKYPYLAAERDGEILGYAYTSPFVGRIAYQYSAETTIYLREDQKRNGLGRRLYQALEEISIQPIGLPYLSNVTADYVEDPAAVRGLLVRQVSSPVRWQQCVERMIADGADTFIEIGPGKSLSGFMRRIDKNVTVKNVEHVEDLEKL